MCVPIVLFGQFRYQIMIDQVADKNCLLRVIGTLEEYPTEELAQAAINGLRTSINEDRNRQSEQR